MSTASTDELTQTILLTIQSKQPRTIQELISLMKQTKKFDEQEIVDRISELQASSEIVLSSSAEPIASFPKYVVSNQGLWFRLTLLFSLLTAVVTFFISENLYPWNLLRNLLGLIFVLWIPGYVFVRAIFPVNSRSKDLSPMVSNVERIALSVIISLSLIALIGFILNLTPWGINLISIISVLLVFNVVVCLIAALREVSATKKSPEIYD